MTQLFEGLNLDTEQGKEEAEYRVFKIYKKKYFDENQSYTQDIAEKLFLDVLNDPKLGGGNSIGIYRKDGDTWGKLKKTGNTIQKEDCN